MMIKSSATFGRKLQGSRLGLSAAWRTTEGGFTGQDRLSQFPLTSPWLENSYMTMPCPEGGWEM